MSPAPPDIDWCAAFATLRRRWIARASEGERRTSAQLAELLSARSGRHVRPARCSVWARGSDRRHSRPPFAVIAVLMEDLGVDLVIAANGSVRLRECVKGSAPRVV